ncbi:hypothetical protein ERW51_18160 [Aliivibrio finisterrensis]|nr:hypothetical protein ERW54_18735 [Aliivibrio finisterrensis]RYU67281.1 hypothetical protein ERW51_18160 [Aliivibrio finisterrensis]RYU69728.1 hypothetical protein ERW48_18755 [Aliivibrio finisterrensis]
MQTGKAQLTNASTRFATFGILGFFDFTVLSGKFGFNLHSSKRVMQALHELKIAVFWLSSAIEPLVF